MSLENQPGFIEITECICRETLNTEGFFSLPLEQRGAIIKFLISGTEFQFNPTKRRLKTEFKRSLNQIKESRADTKLSVFLLRKVIKRIVQISELSLGT